MEESSNLVPEEPLREGKRPRRETKMPEKYAMGVILNSSDSEQEDLKVRVKKAPAEVIDILR